LGGQSTRGLGEPGHEDSVPMRLNGPSERAQKG
jgi:hypothetical protein